ncbi:MAG: zf-TFIIB domain-containing protein [Phycisphaerae bacterium]|nr:zf-TFIIB domain-containing protein [Phycisphaerae bacterium]
MKCPACTTADLMMTERAGVEVDYCPKCRGIWLDRGELDKIIQRASAEERGSGAPPPSAQVQSAVPQQHVHPHPTPRRHPSDDDSNDDSKYGYRYQQQGQPYRKKSIWRELFDF